jgi:NADH-quinone oxidoreductase subunit H
VLWAVVKAVIILLGAVIFAAYLSFIERRVLALWQDRYGPNRVGPFGIFQLPADVVKMLFKEDWIPPFADKLTFLIAPIIAMSALFISYIIIPVTPTWYVADFDIGILFFMAMAGLAVYAVLFAGWSSNNKYSLLGGLRSAAQTVSYEVFMGLSLMGVVAQTGSFNMREIVEAQRELWFIVPQFLGFCTFSLAAIAVTHRSPFDLPEAEQELAAGYHTEYAGMKFAMFFLAEYANMFAVSAIAATVFFGGWTSPFGSFMAGPWWGAFWFLLKSMVFVFVQMWLRWTLPRLRVDQLMYIGWKVLIPFAFAVVLGVGFFVLATA